MGYLDGASSGFLMFEAGRIFEKKIKDEREWKKKAIRRAPSTHPRMLEPFCHTRKSVGIPVGIARAFCHNATVLRPLRNNQPLWLPMIL